MFNSLSSDLQKLFFSRAQIKSFVKKHHEWLCYETLFLYKSNGQFFVAEVLIEEADLHFFKVLPWDFNIPQYGYQRLAVQKI